MVRQDSGELNTVWFCKCGKIRNGTHQCGYCGDKPNKGNIVNKEAKVSLNGKARA